MKRAIVKPDHIGDLVLSAAAIRAFMSYDETATLFVSSGCQSLATSLFGPAADIRVLDLPHLGKHATSRAGRFDFREFDLVVFLRHDNVVNPEWAELRCRDYVFPVDSHRNHQSQLDYGVVAPLIGHYDIDAAQLAGQLDTVRRKAQAPPRSIGLCIGSGFHANIWPASHWYDLAKALQRQDRTVSIVCGPSEAGLGYALAQGLGLGPAGLILGGRDIDGFLQRVGELDWVIASDGGAGHLCSLRTPVLSIFGPSPFRRYAPYGRWNRLLTRDLSCSPCCQWTSTLVNGCLSVECLADIAPAQVLQAFGPPYASSNDAGMIRLAGGIDLYEGVSHLDLHTLKLHLGPDLKPSLTVRTNGHGGESASDGDDAAAVAHVAATEIVSREQHHAVQPRQRSRARRQPSQDLQPTQAPREDQ